MCLATPVPRAPAPGRTAEARPAPATSRVPAIRSLGRLTTDPPRGPGTRGVSGEGPGHTGSLHSAPPCTCVCRTAALDTARWRTPGRRWSSTCFPSEFEPAEGCPPGRAGLELPVATSAGTSPKSLSLQDPLAFGKCVSSSKIALYFFYSIVGYSSCLSRSRVRVMGAGLCEA